MDDDTLYKLLCTKGAKLQTLNVRDCPQLTKRAVTLVTRLAKNVVELDLSGVRVDDDAVCQLSRRLIHLRKLRLSDGVMTDAGAKTLGRVGGLIWLELCNMSHLTDSGVSALFSSRAACCGNDWFKPAEELTGLEHLCIDGCVKVGAKGVMFAVGLCCRLGGRWCAQRRRGRKLRTLLARGTSVRASVVMWVAKRRPDVRVVVDAVGFGDSVPEVEEEEADEEEDEKDEDDEQGGEGDRGGEMEDADVWHGNPASAICELGTGSRNGGHVRA